MNNSAEMFKKLAQSRQKPTQAKGESNLKEETKPESEVKKSAEKILPTQTPEKKRPEAEITAELPTKKRGRPATGKRSDPNWIGRTYYIRKETDLDIEDELIKLKRADINLDKSELVDFLLAAWVKWRKGDNINFCIPENSPRQKDELS